MGSINSNSLLNTNLLLEETKKQNKKLNTKSINLGNMNIYKYFYVIKEEDNE